MEVVVSLSQGRTAAAQCGLFTYKSVPVIFEPPCRYMLTIDLQSVATLRMQDNSLLFYTAYDSSRCTAWAYEDTMNIQSPCAQALRQQEYGHNDYIGWF